MANKSLLRDRVVGTSDPLLFGVVRDNGGDEYRWILKRRPDPNGPDRFDPPTIVDTDVRQGSSEAFRSLYRAIAHQGELAA